MRILLLLILHGKSSRKNVLVWRMHANSRQCKSVVNVGSDLQRFYNGHGVGLRKAGWAIQANRSLNTPGCIHSVPA